MFPELSYKYLRRKSQTYPTKLTRGYYISSCVSLVSQICHFFVITSGVKICTLNIVCAAAATLCVFVCPPAGDGQVDFEEFMTILGPKLLSSDNREGFLGNTIDNIFWQVRDEASLCRQTVSSSSLRFPVTYRLQLFYLI